MESTPPSLPLPPLSSTSPSPTFNPPKTPCKPLKTPPNLRQSGKKRAKLSRDRKKAYITQLEQKIDYLESENFRLQNLLVSYRSSNLDLIGQDTENFVDWIRNKKKKVIEEVILKEKQESEGEMGVYEHFSKGCMGAMKKHQEFRDSIFRMAVNYPFPGCFNKYWGHLEDWDVKDYDVILKYYRCKKYMVEEYKEKHNINPLDELIASLKPTHKQYKILLKILEKEKNLKEKYTSAVSHILEGKDILEKTNIEHLLHKKFLLGSKIFSDQQIITSNFSDGYYSNDNAFEDIFKIKTTPQSYTSDLQNCPIYGKLAKRIWKEGIKNLTVTYNKFHF